MGMNMKFGAAPTHTPPKPISKPLTRFKPSMKTVRLSNLPSPSVSSKTRMRSLPCRGADGIGVGLGDPEPAAVIDGESNGLLHIRFAGEERGFEIGRQGHFLGGVLGREAGEFDGVHRGHLLGGRFAGSEFVG